MDLDFFVTLAELMGKGALLLLEYLKVLIWPVVVLILASIYRKPLVSVLYRLRKASGLGATVELENQSLELAQAAVSATVLEEQASEPGIVVVPDADEDNLSPDPDLESAPEEAAHLDSPVSTSATSRPVSVPPKDAESFSDQVIRQWLKSRNKESSASALESVIRHMSIDNDWSYARGRLGPSDESTNLNRIWNSWRQLEGVSSKSSELLGLSDRPRSVRVIARALHKRELLSAGVIPLVDELVDLRNRIFHPSDDIQLTTDLADGFVVSAEAIAKMMRIANSKLGAAGNQTGKQ